MASQGGVFSDDKGQVKAIWMSFSTDNERHEQSSVMGGLPSKLVLPVIEKIKKNQSIEVRGLDVEFWTLQISNARLLGVSDDWIERLKKQTRAKTQPSVIYVLGITDISSPSGQLLRPGDIVLSINDKEFANISDLGRYAEHEQLNLVSVCL